MAGDRALGLITRPQMLTATEAGTVRLDEIGAELDTRRGRTCWPRWSPPRTPPPSWADLDISRKRAVIKTLMSVTLYSPGRGARRPFDPATVKVTWRQPDAA